MEKCLLISLYIFLSCFPAVLKDCGSRPILPNLNSLSQMQCKSYIINRRPANEDSDTLKRTFIRIQDERGKLTAAKIRVTAYDSTYYAPYEHLADFPISEGGDVMLNNNRRFAYVDGSLMIDLPEAENIRLEVIKGFAYQFYGTTSVY